MWTKCSSAPSAQAELRLRGARGLATVHSIMLPVFRTEAAWGQRTGYCAQHHASSVPSVMLRATNTFPASKRCSLCAGEDTHLRGAIPAGDGELTDESECLVL